MNRDWVCLNPKCPPKLKEGFHIVYWSNAGRCKWCHHKLKETAGWDKLCHAWFDSEKPFRDAALEWFKAYVQMRLYELTKTERRKLNLSKIFNLALLLGNAQIEIQKRLNDLINLS